jgi:hypothetical protein
MPVDQQWLPIAGFLITWTTGVIGLVKAVQSIKTDVSEKIAAEVLARTTALSDAVVKRNEEMETLRRDFIEAQRIQDNHVGEMGAALRRFIESVEKEMHSIEIWNRDNFVQKGEFERATDSIKADIKAMASDIKADIKDLKVELGGKSN